MTCDTYFSTDARCPVNRHAVFNAGHYCGLVPGHAKEHRCGCGATKARAR